MRITQYLAGVEPSLSFEFFPPKTEAARGLLTETFSHLLEFEPNFISVTYGAGGGTRNLSLEVCRDLHQRNKCEVMAHLTAIGQTEEELAEVSDNLYETGIRNIMALRGDAPRNEEDRKASRFLYGSELIAFLKARHEFCCGGGCYPEGHAEESDLAVGIEHLKIKQDAGCDFLVTQMFFDNDVYLRFRDRAVASGVTLPIVPGLMPLTGVKQATTFEAKFNVSLPEELKENIEAAREDEVLVNEVGTHWAAEQCRELLNHGAPGIHFYTLNRASATKSVCEVLDLSGRRHVHPEATT